MILRDRVTRQRATTGGDDGYGNTRPEWSSPATAVYPAAVVPMSANEDVVDQVRTVTKWRLFLPPGADVTATDRIVWRGAVYEVDGDMERHHRRARVHHFEAVLIKVTQS